MPRKKARTTTQTATAITFAAVAAILYGWKESTDDEEERDDLEIAIAFFRSAAIFTFDHETPAAIMSALDFVMACLKKAIKEARKNGQALDSERAELDYKSLESAKNFLDSFHK
jgi:hypothetical protein